MQCFGFWYTMAFMRYLGIDFGTKRVGLSLSDDQGDMAFPLSVIENSNHLVDDIVSICLEKEVKGVVVGDSKDFAMKDNQVMKYVNIFVADFKDKINIPVFFHPEFLTSLEAKQIQGKNDMLDASAATIMLQSYLDTQKNDIN